MNRLDQLLELLNGSPDEPFLLFALAKEYEGSGKLSEAMDYYRQLLSTDPEYVGAYYHTGKLYEKFLQPDKAIEIYGLGLNVAKRQKDMHSFSELKGAKLNLTDEEDE